jgi:large subunit ribosomal protein L10
MRKDEKSTVVAELRQKFQAADAAIFVDFRGLRVGEVTELRSLLRKESGTMLVIKNTLAGLAAQGTQFEPIAARLEGPTAMVIAPEVRGSAKVLTDFAKGHDKLGIKFCILQGKVLEGSEAEAIAKMPSRDELRAQILGLINAPAAQLLAQINAPGQQLAGVLQAWMDKRKEEGGADEVQATEEGGAGEVQATGEGGAGEAQATGEGGAGEAQATEEGQGG